MLGSFGDCGTTWGNMLAICWQYSGNTLTFTLAFTLLFTLLFVLFEFINHCRCSGGFYSFRYSPLLNIRLSFNIFSTFTSSKVFSNKSSLMSKSTVCSNGRFNFVPHIPLRGGEFEVDLDLKLESSGSSQNQAGRADWAEQIGTGPSERPSGSRTSQIEQDQAESSSSSKTKRIEHQVVHLSAPIQLNNFLFIAHKLVHHKCRLIAQISLRRYSFRHTYSNNSAPNLFVCWTVMVFAVKWSLACSSVWANLVCCLARSSIFRAWYGDRLGDRHVRHGVY